MKESDSSPFFSVIVPTYNRADFIVNTLETVFKQSYKNFEIIVVDNCSTDNTKVVLNKYIKSGDIVFIQHDRNYERGKSRNTGMMNAKGDFVTFLDSDDFMYPDNLLDAKRYIEQNPEIKIFHNLYELVDQTGALVFRYPIPDISNPLKQISIGNFLSCIGVFINREIYQRFLFDEDTLITGSEDWDFWLRILPHFPELGQIKKINSGILQHPDRTVNQQDLKKISERKLLIIDKLLKDPYYKTIYGKQKKRLISNIYIYVAIMANEYGMFNETRQHLVRAFKKNMGVLFGVRFIKAYLHSLIRK